MKQIKGGARIWPTLWNTLRSVSMSYQLPQYTSGPEVKIISITHPLPIDIEFAQTKKLSHLACDGIILLWTPGVQCGVAARDKASLLLPAEPGMSSRDVLNLMKTVFH